MKPNDPIYDEVPVLYPKGTAVLLATGPSLTEEQIKYIRPFRDAGIISVFGLNDAYRLCDFMDVFYACDPRWWDHNLEVLDNPCPHKWTQDKKWVMEHPEAGVKLVSGGGGKGLSKSPHHIHYGSNSGYQLINLAWHYGIRKFILLGYNMDVPRGKQQHFFGPHPKPLNRTNNYKGFVSQYRTIDEADKKLIINCTEPSALDCFIKKPLEEVLPVSLIAGEEDGSGTDEPTTREADPSDLQEQERDSNRHRPIVDPVRFGLPIAGAGK